MSVEVESVYRRNNDNKLSIVTRKGDTWRRLWAVATKLKFSCVAAALGGDVDDMMIVLIISR